MRTADPCHTFDESDALPAGAPVTRSVFLDTTRRRSRSPSPSPEGVLFDSDDFSAIEFSVTDAGSGVNQRRSRRRFDNAPATKARCWTCSCSRPGTHAVKVFAADNLGNATDTTRSFELHATLREPVEQHHALLRRGPDQQEGHLQLAVDQLEHALDKHNGNRHDVEHNQLGAFINHTEAQRGKSIDTATANRLIAFARDLQ